MDAVQMIRAMARNNAFSNHRLGAALARLSQEDFAAPRTSFFPSLRETANHILEVDLYYLDALAEGGRGTGIFDAFVPHEDPAGYVAAQAEADRTLVAFCDALDTAALAREVATDRGERGPVIERTDALLLHLFQHQIHHRGQLHAMLAGTDVAPPQLDEYFLRYDREARAGDMAELGFDQPTV
jgi:uncharacterized damage-inducible protein DinB